MDVIQPALFSKEITTLASYKVMPFSETDGDGAYAIRVIEIYRAYKMRGKLKQFSRLTGHPALFPEPTMEEITSLINRGLSLINPEEKELESRKSDADRYSREAETTTKKVTRISEMNASANGGSFALSHKASMSAAEYRKQTEKVKALKGLLGLLKEPLTAMTEQDSGMESKKQAARFSGGELARYIYTSGNDYYPPIRCCEFIWNEMDSLERAVESIISLCTPPTDKCDLKNGGEKRAELYREYYSVSNAPLRMAISERDYVSWALNKDKASVSKASFYKKDF